MGRCDHHKKSTTTDKVIQSLKSTFATHGVPSSIRTDNGPQFVSGEFREFLKEYGIFHRKTTPSWPQANVEIERQNSSLLKRLKIAQVEKRNWKDELLTYLMMYRSTPHTVTGVSPSKMLYGRTIRTKLLELCQLDIPVQKVAIETEKPRKRAKCTLTLGGMHKKMMIFRKETLC